MPFYHFVIQSEPRDGTPVKKLKISLMKCMLLHGALLLVGRKCTTGRPKRSDDDDDDDDDAISAGNDDFVSRIVSVRCNDYDLLENLEFPLEDLDSDMTPMTGKTAKEIYIGVGPVPAPAPSLSRPRRNAFDLLLAPPVPTFLPVLANDEEDDTETEESSGNLQEQLRGALPTFYENIQLGYYEKETKALLMTNLNKIGDILCFIKGHWHSLFRLKEPQSSALLRLTKASCRATNR